MCLVSKVAIIQTIEINEKFKLHFFNHVKEESEHVISFFYQQSYGWIVFNLHKSKMVDVLNYTLKPLTFSWHIFGIQGRVIENKTLLH